MAEQEAEQGIEEVGEAVGLQPLPFASCCGWLSVLP